MNEDGFRLAILGGCAASQRCMPISRLYHRILAARWKAKYGTRMNVLLDRHDPNLDYAARVKRCLDLRAPHAILIHVRPFPFLIRCKPFIKYADPSGRIKWALHPRLPPLGRRAWNPGWEGAAVIGTLPAAMAASGDPRKEVYPPYRNSFPRSLNLFLGTITGLSAWARREEILSVRRAAGLCSAAGIPLFVLGPTPYLRSRSANAICAALSDGLRKESDSGHSRSIDPMWRFIDPIGNKSADPRDLLMPDLWHLNEAGHSELADSIFRSLENAKEIFPAAPGPDPMIRAEASAPPADLISLS
jgi:hypothetical protein